MDAKELDAAMVEGRRYARKLMEEFEENFYGDRTPPVRPSFKNFPAQVQALRDFLAQIGAGTAAGGMNNG
jgi:hypothetical protein